MTKKFLNSANVDEMGLKFNEFLNTLVEREVALLILMMMMMMTAIQMWILAFFFKNSYNFKASSV